MIHDGGARPWTHGAILFAVMFALSAACAYIAPRGVPPLLGFAFLAAVPLMSWGRRLSPGVLLVLVLVLWVGISLLWSPLRGEFDVKDLEGFTAFKLLIQLIAFGGLAAAATRLGDAGAERVCRVLAYAYCSLAAVLIFEGLSGAALYQALNALIGSSQRPDLAQRNVAQGGYILVALVWPAIMILRGQKLNVLILLLLDGLLGVMLTLGADAPMIGLLASALAFAAVLAWGRRAVFGVAAGWVGYWLLAPWLVLAARVGGVLDMARTALPVSWTARLDIWSFAVDEIIQKPLIGWGVGASRTFPQIPLHTHNAAIQHWLELGLVGAGLGAAVWAWLFGLIARRADRPGPGRTWAAASTASLTAFLTISSLSFSAWEEWWLGAGGLALIACIALGRFWQVEPVSRRGAGDRAAAARPRTLLWSRPWGKSPAAP